MLLLRKGLLLLVLSVSWHRDGAVVLSSSTFPWRISSSHISMVSSSSSHVSSTVDQADFVCRKLRREDSPSSLVLGFGSCNNQKRRQTAWHYLKDVDAFLFNGDVVYSNSQDVQGQAEAFEELTKNPFFQRAHEELLTKMDCRAVSEGCSVHHGIWSTWDDHDLGINDGGGGESFGSNNLQIDARLANFKKYMHPRCFDSASRVLEDRNGTHHSIDFHVAHNGAARVILMDTRTHRKLHAIPSFGTLSHIPILGKIMPIIGAGSRLLAAHLGWMNLERNTLLGLDQWIWLKHQLCNNNTKHYTHILVSSIQVLTTNPLVESWGHFPIELDQLLDILATCKPSHVLIISGDVHFSEFISYMFLVHNNLLKTKDGHVTEVTSSGMTHTCGNNIVMRKICSSIIKFYSKHRNNVEDAFIVEKSFGQVVLDFSASGSSRQQVSQFSIISSQDGRVIYTRNSTLPKDGSVLRAQLADGCTWGVLSTQPNCTAEVLLWDKAESFASTEVN
eukprot:gene520-3845_t